MKTIALVNQKGGVGKTTLALHLAAAFHRAGFNAVVFDLDPQASATEWHDARADKSPHVESLQPARMAKTITAAREIGVEILILDTAPHAEATALDAIEAADLVLVPSGSSIMDLRAMRKTAKLIRLKTTPAFAVLNAVASQGTEADDAAAAIETDEEIALPVCPVRLVDRVDFNRCLIEGETAQEYAPKGKAAREVEQLLKWTRKQLKL